MSIESFQTWLELNPTLAPWVLWIGALVGNVVVFLITRHLIARGLVHLAQRTENKYDDILVEKMRPFRFAWIAPLFLTYYLAHWWPEGVELIRQVLLVVILWLVVMTIGNLFNAINAMYEASDYYRGQSIQGYLDLGRLLVALVGIIILISELTGQSPLTLLSGLGAVMALLLLMFRDTLLSFVASVQIQSHDLVREGDWIEIPSYSADGAVTNISLHTIRIQNWDKTITVVPTYKLLDTPYKNWRGMEESGGRRIKRSITIDLNSITFCDEEMTARFAEIDLVGDFVKQQLVERENSGKAKDKRGESACDQHSLTNVGIFRAYMANYLKCRSDLHHQDMTLLVRQLPSGPSGLPLEIYVFTRTVEWVEYEGIQADIVEHLLAAASQFDLQVFQEPTGADFQAWSRT